MREELDMFNVQHLPPTPSPTAIEALLQLFDLVSNPAKHKALIDELVRARDEAQKAVAEFEDLTAKRVALDAERDVIRGVAKAHQDRLDPREAQIVTREAAHQPAVSAHARAGEA